METVAFWILAFLCIGSALFVVLGRNAVVCGLALAFNLVTIAGFFLLLNARFLAFVQVMVYAGAIMVLLFAALREPLGGHYFAEPSAEFGTVAALGTELFTHYFYPFEAISVLLLVAMVGAVLLAKKRL
jgi:NADH-quinone oxidoreductase subunit J